MSSLRDVLWHPVDCPLCGESPARKVAKIYRFAVPFAIVRCRECGHVYMDPRPRKEDLPLLYDEEYYAGGGADEAFTYADDRASPEVAALRAAARLERIEELCPPGRLLEVGCSFGAFLLEARRRGWKVSGVDISPYAVAACREEGLEVFEGSLEDAAVPPGSVDVVYLAETVEHLPDPRRTVRAAASVLKTGGLAVIGTANHDSVARMLRGKGWGYYLPGHLQYFTAATLCRLLGEEGFDIESTRFGDDRAPPALRKIRKLETGKPGFLSGVKDAARRLSVAGLSVGAGMIVYARKLP